MPRSPQPSPARPLLELVQERVDAATAKLIAHRRQRKSSEPFAELQGGESPVGREALRHVFRDIGRNQRSARRQTGQAPSPVVRQAALAFRENPSLPALVLVAASLDEVGLLVW